MAFYHRYRPQSLAELSGQTQVVQQLQQAFLANKLSHAYLFVGPRGSGKTSTARILAKMVNCQQQAADSTTEIPCNICVSCLSITDGSSLDLIEIDAASNRGIEDIRSLRETIKLAPTSSPRKVYIIDEVHMLSNEAFNALLKTLEEPPAHVLFILATTESDKIPQTILSRTTRVDFAPGTLGEITQMLSKIATAENLVIEEAALSRIAKLADGSFRDATKLLDQLAATSTQITLDMVNTTLKVSSFDNLFTITQQLLHSDTQAALASVNQLSSQSISLRDFTVALAEFVRSLLLVSLSSLTPSASDFTPTEFEQLQQLSKNTSSQELIRILNYLQNCLEKIKTTALPQLALEVAVIQICQSPSSKPSAPPVVISEPDAPALPTPEPKLTSKNSSSAPTDAVVSQHLTLLQDKWVYILETIRPHNFSLEAIMRTVKLLRTEADLVVLEAPYSFHQRIIESPKNRSLLEALFSDVVARPVKIQVIVGERPDRDTEVANIDLATDDEILRAAAEIFNSDPIES